MKPYPILSNKAIAPDHYILRFKRDFEFIPGQVIGISIDNLIPPRLYSICSGNLSEYIDILYKIKDKGLLTPCLSKLNIGDTIQVSSPKGKFVSSDEKAIWIGAGTGIAPFVSMFLSGIRSVDMLIHGASKQELFFYHEQFLSHFSDKYIRCCTKETADNLFHGRITDYLNQIAHLPENCKYYICGSAEMVVDVREILLSKGIGYEKLNAEIYF